jgi:hypothetical protein
LETIQKADETRPLADTATAPLSPGWSRWGQAARIVALAGFPASIVSAGATISMAVVSLFGLALLWRDRDFPDDLRSVQWKILPLYALIILVELANGGSVAGLGSTAFNYLPLIALAPYAYALRKLGIEPILLDRMIAITLAVGAAISVVISFVYGDQRPGGLDMDALSYGYVLGVWSLFVFSRALNGGRQALPLMLLVALSSAVLFYAKTRIIIVILIVGILTISAIWVVQYRRWRVFFVGSAVAISAFSLMIYYFSISRFSVLYESVAQFLTSGEITPDGSLGPRFAQIRAGWQAFLDKPLLGHGNSDKHSAILQYFEGNPEWRIYIIHNDYVAHIVAFGVFGAIFLLGYFVATFTIMKNAGDLAHRRAGISMVVTMPLFMTAYIVFNMSPMSALVTLAMGAVLSTPFASRSNDP